MACDSASSNGDLVTAIRTPKVWRHVDGGLVGSCGSWAVITALSALSVGACDPRVIARTLAALPYKLKGVEVLIDIPGSPLILMDDQGAILELQSPFFSVGSGANYAIGYLEACDGISLFELRGAIACAAKYSPSVTPPTKVFPEL